MGLKQYSIQLADHVTGKAITAAGGVCYVATNGDTLKQALKNADGSTLANPVSLTRGHIDFHIADTVTLVDLYVMAPAGQFVVVEDLAPSGPNEIRIDTNQRHQLAVIPFAIGDTTAATETDTGFDEPANAVFLPDGASVRVTTLDATQTIDVGTAVGESGDPNGFLATGYRLRLAGVAKGTLARRRLKRWALCCSVDESPAMVC